MYTVVVMAALSGSPSTPGFHGYYGTSHNHAVASIRNGKLTVLTIHVHMVPETHARTVRDKDKDGKAVERRETYTVLKPMAHDNVMVFEVDKVKALDVGGRPLSLTGRFTQPARVVTVHDAQALDSTLRSVLKPDVVVLVLPQAEPVVIDPRDPDEKEKRQAPKKPEAPKHSFPIPKNPAPSVASASLDTRGNVVLQQSGGHVHSMPAYYDRVVNGTVEKVRVQVEMNNFFMNQQTMDVRAVRGLETSGKEVPQSAFMQRLRGSPKVLVAPGGSVDPFYMEVYRGDVLIVVPPNIEHLHGPGPGASA